MARFPGRPGQLPGPVARLPGPVARFPGPVARFPGPVARFSGPVARFPGPVARFPGLLAHFPGPPAAVPHRLTTRSSERRGSVRLCWLPFLPPSLSLGPLGAQMPLSVSRASRFQSRRLVVTRSSRSFPPQCSAGLRAARACSAGRAFLSFTRGSASPPPFLARPPLHGFSSVLASPRFVLHVRAWRTVAPNHALQRTALGRPAFPPCAAWGRR